MKKHLIGLVGALVIGFTSVPYASAFEYEQSENLQHGKTPDGSYDYVVWHDGDRGERSFDGDKLDGGVFNCKWSDVSSCSFAKGHVFEDEEKSYKELGGIECDYSIEYSADGNSWYGIHGVVDNREEGYQQIKYAECFIVDGYIDYRPCTDCEPLASADIDGCKYDIYRVKITAFDAPTFYQYWSVISSEDNKAQSGSTEFVSRHIDVSRHFDEWEKAGIDLSGNIYEITFDVEGWESSGEANVTKNDLVIGSGNEPAYEECDVNGDDEFNIADVLLLQKWLLSAPDASLVNWKAADLCSDNRLNVFDLCLMKRKLFSKEPIRIVEPDYRDDYGAPFYVVKDGLKMYAGPNERYPVVTTISKSARLRELGHHEGNDQWLFTEYQGQYGWISVIDEEDNTPTVRFDVAAAKPVIYLYPEKETDVHVELELSESELSTTYPRYNNGWDVTAYPDGTLINKADGTRHRYLFWDSKNCRTRFDFSKGFCVAGCDTESFLREKLTYMGLTEDEMNEFIVYWLPLMEHNKYNLISFQSKAYTDSAKLAITPAPDSLCRIFMAYVPLENAVETEPQQLETFERKGFAVVEWGGCEIKQDPAE